MVKTKIVSWCDDKIHIEQIAELCGAFSVKCYSLDVKCPLQIMDGDTVWGGDKILGSKEDKTSKSESLGGGLQNYRLTPPSCIISAF